MKRMLTDRLRPGMIVGESIFPSKYSIVPLIKEDSFLTPELIDKVRRRGIPSILIKEDFDKPAEKPVETRTIATPAGDIYIPRRDPIVNEELRSNAIENLEELFSTLSIAEGDVHESSVQIIRHLDRVVEQLVDSLEQDRGTLVNISDLKSFDEYTYHHSLSVAVLSIALGQYMGFNEEGLNQLGRCAMLHDIGKTAIPIDVIHKPSRLSNKEFKMMKFHSPAGYDYLAKQDIGDEDLWRGVLHHHEKYDGSGYPYGLSGNNIPIWSRIISVADVYDALTSNRPYREPMQPAEAIEYIMGGTGTAFDYDMVEAFIKKVELYPAGSFVELSNARIGVVIDNENHMRPVVKLIDSGDILDLFHDHNCLSLVINRVIPEEEVVLQGIAALK